MEYPTKKKAGFRGDQETEYLHRRAAWNALQQAYKRAPTSETPGEGRYWEEYQREVQTFALLSIAASLHAMSYCVDVDVVSGPPG